MHLHIHKDMPVLPGDFLKMFRTSVCHTYIQACKHGIDTLIRLICHFEFQTLSARVLCGDNVISFLAFQKEMESIIITLKVIIGRFMPSSAKLSGPLKRFLLAASDSLNLAIFRMERSLIEAQSSAAKLSTADVQAFLRRVSVCPVLFCPVCLSVCLSLCLSVVYMYVCI